MIRFRGKKIKLRRGQKTDEKYQPWQRQSAARAAPSAGRLIQIMPLQYVFIQLYIV